MKETSLKPFDMGISDSGGVRPGDIEIRQLKNIYWALRRAAPIILATSFAVGVVVYLLTYTQEEKFTSVAKVMLDTRVATETDFTPDVSGLPISLTTLESEIEVLRSTDMIESVVERFELYNDPEFTGEGGGISLSPIALLRQLKKKLVSAIRNGGNRDSENEEVTQAIEREQTIKAVLNSRDIRQIGDASAVYAVSITSVDPKKAAEIANALTEEYIIFQTQTKRNLLEQSQGWLTTRIGQLQLELNNLSSQLESHEIEQPFTADEYATIKAERVTNARRRKEAQGELDTLSRQYNGFAMLESNGMINAALKYAEDFGLLQGVASDELSPQEKSELVAETGDRMRERIAGLEARLQQLNGKIDDLQEKQTLQIKHDAITRRIENDIAVTETIYRDFVSQLSRRTEQDDYLDPDVRIIEKARPPIEPSEPKRAMSSLVSMIVFLVIGTVATVLREMFQNRLRTGFEYEDFTGLKPAGFIPEVKNESPRRSFFMRKNHFDPKLLRFGRKLWASSDLGMSDTHLGDKTDEDCKIVAGASAVPKEGQSTALLLLGKLCAENDLRTLIVDCDHVHSPYAYLKEYSPKEIERIRSGELFAADFVRSTPQKGLDILPVMVPRDHGDSTPQNTVPIQFSSVFEDILDSFRNTYDLILLDTPPLLTAVEAASLLRFADDILVFTRWNHSSRTSVAGVLNAVEESGRPASAVIPTRVKLSQAKKFGDPSFAFEG